MDIVIYTDGASRGNPGPGGWAAVTIKNDDSRKGVEQTQKNAEVIEIGGREEKTTNNRMELTAAIHALREVKRSNIEHRTSNIVVHSDSSYVINGVTKWVTGWQKNGWQTKTGKKVLNQDLWQSLSELNDELAPEWEYVAGHAGTPGNERADQIATLLADNEEADLYEGPLSDYDIGLANGPSIGHEAAAARKKGKKGKAYSYISMVDGKIKKHSTWAECEKRVKGVKGAKYRKAVSAEEESRIVSEFRSLNGNSS